MFGDCTSVLDDIHGRLFNLGANASAFVSVGCSAHLVQSGGKIICRLNWFGCAAEADGLIYSSVYGWPMQSALSSNQNTLNHTNLRTAVRPSWWSGRNQLYRHSNHADRVNSVENRHSVYIHGFNIEWDHAMHNIRCGWIGNLSMRTELLLNMLSRALGPLFFDLHRWRYLDTICWPDSSPCANFHGANIDFLPSPNTASNIRRVACGCEWVGVEQINHLCNSELVAFCLAECLYPRLHRAFIISFAEPMIQIIAADNQSFSPYVWAKCFRCWKLLTPVFIRHYNFISLYSHRLTTFSTRACDKLFRMYVKS